MSLFNAPSLLLGIFIAGISSAWGMEIEDEIKSEITIDREEEIQFLDEISKDKELIITSNNNLEKSANCSEKCCWCVGFSAGKSISCLNRQNHVYDPSENCCGHCSTRAYLSTNTFLAADIFLNFISALMSCEKQNPDPSCCLLWKITASCACISVSSVGCVLGTYFCCDQCLGCTSCPKGFRNGVVCRSDHTCGPILGATIMKSSSNCYEYIGRFFDKFREKVLAPCCKPCTDSCSKAFDTDRL